MWSRSGLVLAAVAGAEGFSCKSGLRCTQLQANNYTFDCRLGGPADGVPVMFLHGFPEFATMYQDTQIAFAADGVLSLACNQRGYSPGASPDGVENYYYDLMRDDIWALADAAGLKKFHLVGHDHGAALGWVTAASETGKERLLSYSALSVPHADAFTAGLAGTPDEVDVDQQVASQYFTMFTMNNSASLHFGALYHTTANGGTDKYSDRFNSAEEFQKAVWWYNGAINAGFMALPPLFSASELLVKYGNPAMASLRELYSGSALSKAHPNGYRGTRRAGNVTIPTLFVCGTSDTALLCTKPYSLKTKDYVTADYKFLTIDCGHDVTSESCTDYNKTRTAILARIGK